VKSCMPRMRASVLEWGLPAAAVGMTCQGIGTFAALTSSMLHGWGIGRSEPTRQHKQKPA
jgi:hypothetical protein